MFLIESNSRGGIPISNKQILKYIKIKNHHTKLELQKNDFINCYHNYKFSNKEIMFVLLKGILQIVFISYIFYRSIWCIFLFSPYLIFYFQSQKELYKKRRLEQLKFEFKEGIVSIAAALNAGYSLENSVISATQDLKILYPKGSFIEQEFELMIKKNHMNVEIQTTFLDFANRCKISEIEDFANIIMIAKKSGGDLVKIIYKTAERLSRKIEISREIESSLSAKKLEQKIMFLMPFLIILYIQYSNYGYMDGLYHNIFGICFMTICFSVIVGTNIWAKKIVDIEV